MMDEGSDDFDADTAQRYGWINRALPDAELVGVSVTRIGVPLATLVRSGYGQAAQHALAQGRNRRPDLLSRRGGARLPSRRSRR